MYKTRYNSYICIIVHTLYHGETNRIKKNQCTHILFFLPFPIIILQEYRSKKPKNLPERILKKKREFLCDDQKMTLISDVMWLSPALLTYYPLFLVIIPKSILIKLNYFIKKKLKRYGILFLFSIFVFLTFFILYL